MITYIIFYQQRAISKILIYSDMPRRFDLPDRKYFLQADRIISYNLVHKALCKNSFFS